ncbi:LOW QUALITY PROTEIN: uncharacterized protein WM294_015816 [Sarcoramphus papa]
MPRGKGKHIVCDKRICPDTICCAICPVCCISIKYVYPTEFGYSFYIYSSIHDHSDSHCFMKILQGNLKETLFEWPEKKGNGEMTKKSERVLRENQCIYINDSIGLHHVENISHMESAVSLHLYSPPFDSCNTFDQGHKHKVKMTFYSQFGERTLCCSKASTHFINGKIEAENLPSVHDGIGFGCCGSIHHPLFPSLVDWIQLCERWKSPFISRT